MIFIFPLIVSAPYETYLLSNSRPIDNQITSQEIFISLSRYIHIYCLAPACSCSMHVSAMIRPPDSLCHPLGFLAWHSRPCALGPIRVRGHMVKALYVCPRPYAQGFLCTSGVKCSPRRNLLKFFPHWGSSSAGRALRSQCRGREFDPPLLHQYSMPNLNRLGISFARSMLIENAKTPNRK